MGQRGLRVVASAIGVIAIAACSLFCSRDYQSAPDDDAGQSADASSADGDDGRRDADVGDAISTDAALPEGLVAHWPFEGSGVDATGKGHTLIAVKTVFVDAGIRGGAVRCPDNGSHLESTSADLGWGPNGVTIISWVKIEPRAGDAPRTIFESGRNADWTNGANNALGFGLGLRADPSLDVQVADGGDTAGKAFTAPPNDANFHAIAFVGSRSGAQVYVDGVSNGVVPLTDAGPFVDPDPFFQLCGHENENHPLGGVLDEVMVWDRALSAEEIASVIKALTP